jgi:hypothetical protein
MTDPDRPAMFEYRNAATGAVIATGPLSLLNERLAAQATAEGAIRAAALAAGRIAADTARVDALDARQRDLDAREDAIRMGDSIRRLNDAATALGQRMDAFLTRRKAERAALDAMDPERQADEGHLEVLPAPVDRDKEELDARAEVETAIEEGRGDGELELRHRVPDENAAPEPPLRLITEAGEPRPLLRVGVADDGLPRREDYVRRKDWLQAVKAVKRARGL